MRFKKIDMEKALSEEIVDLLVGGSTDPGYTELHAAATLYVVLKNLGLNFRTEIFNEEELIEQLRGENICNEDFLKPFIEE